MHQWWYTKVRRLEWSFRFYYFRIFRFTTNNIKTPPFNLPSKLLQLIHWSYPKKRLRCSRSPRFFHSASCWLLSNQTPFQALQTNYKSKSNTNHHQSNSTKRFHRLPFETFTPIGKLNKLLHNKTSLSFLYSKFWWIKFPRVWLIWCFHW
jgi:hypothetical protein